MMTIDKQSMLTTVLAFAVTVLVVDRAIEPAYAQNCLAEWQVQSMISGAANKVITTVNGCLGTTTIYGTEEHGQILVTDREICSP
jgi:hypothetical protein